MGDVDYEVFFGGGVFGNYEVVWSDRGGATQVYDLNLHNARREAKNPFSNEPGEGER